MTCWPAWPTVLLCEKKLGCKTEVDVRKPNHKRYKLGQNRTDPLVVTGKEKYRSVNMDVPLTISCLLTACQADNTA